MSVNGLLNQMLKSSFQKFVPYLVVVFGLVLTAPFLPSYPVSMATKVLIFSIFAISLDLVMGYSGLVSLGHAVFFALGGYAVGIIMLRLNITSLWIVVPLGIIITGLIAAVIGLVCLRVSGIYFLLITLAFGELFSVAATNWRSLTGGSDGLIGIDLPAIGLAGVTWSKLGFFYFVLAVLIICFILLYRIINSPFGHALVGIRENERRMIALGYDTWLYKYFAFILGGIFAAVAGALFAPFYGAMVPEHFAISMSTFVMLMVAIGGPGTLYGPVIGAVFVVLLEQIASHYSPERWPLILGLVFIFAVFFIKGGIGSYLRRIRQ